MSEDVSVSGYEVSVTCPVCGQGVRFNETGVVVECPVFNGPASGCGAEFIVSATAEVVDGGDSNE